MKSCPDEWYYLLPVIRVAKWLSVDAQGQRGKGTGAALEKQFYVTADEKCSAVSSLAFCPFIFKYRQRRRQRRQQQERVQSGGF